MESPARGRLTFVAAACVVAFGVQPAPVAKDTWIGVRTPHLNIISNAGEGATRNVAQRLERFVDGLAAFAGPRIDPDVPVTVMLFRNDASFAPFRPKRDGRTIDLSGYFQRADDENLIALSLESGTAAEPYRVIFHEYAHALMARSATLWPLWLQEGLADFYSAFQSDSRRFALGDWIRDHPRLLLAQRLLPIRELLTVDLNSPTYLESHQDLFYAQSWLLTHYFMAGDGGRRRAGLDQFIDGISQGLPVDRAFEEAFRINEPTLQEELRRYLTDGRYVGATLAIQRPAPNVSAAIRTLGDADAEVAQGSLLMRVGRGDEADAYFSRARSLDLHAARLDESQGFLALARGRYEEAAAHLQKAIAQDPNNHLAHYYYAETLRRQQMEQGKLLSADVARAMAEPLRAVVALKPGFVRAYYLLGYAHSVTGDDLGEGARLLETAIRLAPPHRAAMLTLASIQLKKRDYNAAKTTAEAIIRSSDASDALKKEARLIADTAGAQPK